jgi:hypothetical protein
MDIDVRADMLKGIAGLSLGEQLGRIEGVKSEFLGLLSKDEINLAKLDHLVTEQQHNVCP